MRSGVERSRRLGAERLEVSSHCMNTTKKPQSRVHRIVSSSSRLSLGCCRSPIFYGAATARRDLSCCCGEQQHLAPPAALPYSRHRLPGTLPCSAGANSWAPSCSRRGRPAVGCARPLLRQRRESGSLVLCFNPYCAPESQDPQGPPSRPGATCLTPDWQRVLLQEGWSPHMGMGGLKVETREEKALIAALRPLGMPALVSTLLASCQRQSSCRGRATRFCWQGRIHKARIAGHNNPSRRQDQ